MKKTLLIIWMVVLTSIVARAQDTSALPYLAIDRNPATSAMGGLQVISATYNPAAAAFKESDVVFSFQNWAPNAVNSMNFNLLGGLHFGKLGITFTGAYQAGKAYDLIDDTGNVSGNFKPSDMLGGVGFGYAFLPYLSAGLNVKYAGSTLSSNAKYNTVAGDLFVMFKQNGIEASAGIANLGTPIKSGNLSYALPTSVKTGAAYTLLFGASSVNFGADLDYFFTGGIGLAVGAAFDWNSTVFVRAGYHFGTDKAPVPSYASLGLGAKFQGIHIDLSFLTASKALGNTLSLGVGYAF